MRRAWAAILIWLTFLPSKAQDSSRTLKHPALTVSAGLATAYTGAMLALNEYWYKDFERSRFHFFNDGDEWLQIDKAGHFFSSYQLSRYSALLYREAGLEKENAARAGFLASAGMMAGIEVLDGFSAGWGASLYDLAFNLGGAGLAAGQLLLWNEERIQMKISYRRETYPPDLTARLEALYGRSLPERILKDYNGLIIWTSVNVASFLPEKNRFPSWLNLAFGYGASGLLGARANSWCAVDGISPGQCAPGDLIVRDDIPRLRQFYLSPDLDFTKIPHRKKWQGRLLFVLNMIKLPAPALELNSDGRLRLLIR